MADYPLGRPDRVRVISDPDPNAPIIDLPLDPVERDLLLRDVEQRSRSNPLAPPADMPGDPWVVPAGLWRQAAADSIRRSGAALAVRNDGADLAFNYRAQGALEGAVGQFDVPLNPRALVAARRAYDYDLASANMMVERTITQMGRDASRANGGVALPDVLTSVRMGAAVAVAGQLSLSIVTPGMEHVAGVLGWVGKGLSAAFDGRRFVKHFTTQAWLWADALADGGLRYGDDPERVSRDYDALYEQAPRPVQLLIDELSPGAIVMGVAGGGLARLVGGLTVPGARAAAWALRPMSEGFTALLRQAAFGVGLRLGYEETDGLYMPVRIAAGVGAAILAGNPEAVLHPSAKYMQGVWRALVEKPELAAPRTGGTVLSSALFPGVTPENAVAAARALAPTGPRVVGSGLGAVYGFVSGDELETRLERAAFYGALGYGATAYATRGGLRRPLQPPDVLPMHFPPGAQAVRAVGSAARNPVERFGMQHAEEYAADLADQLSKPGSEGLAGEIVPAVDVVVPEAIAHALQQSRNAIREDGQVAEQLLDMLPGGSAVHNVFNPSGKLTLAVRQAYWAAGSVMNTLRMRLMPSRLTYQEQMLQRFGGLDDAPNVRYIGSETGTRPLTVLDPATGKGRVMQVPDAEHPLRGKLVDIAENPTMYDLMPDDRALLAQVDTRNTEALSVARTQYGVQAGEYPVTGVMHLPIIDKKGLPGIEIKQESDALIAGRFSPRRFETITERMADPVAGLGFEPVTDMRYLLEALDESKINAAGGSAMRWGIGGQVENTGGLRYIEQWGVYVTDETAASFQHLTGGQPGAAEDALTNVLNSWRQLRLSADSSPLTIQGALSAAADPVGTARALVSAFARGDLADMLSSRSLADDWARDPDSWIRFASNVGIQTRLGTPEEFRAGVTEKLPLIGGKIKGMNDSLFNLNVRAMKRMYDQQIALLVREGTGLDVAEAAAADTVTRIIPFMAARKLGLNAARQRWENALPTSASFIRQTLAFTTEAATGYIKLGALAVDKVTPGTIGQWARLSARERLAVQVFTQMQGTMLGLSVASSIATADERHLTVAEAAQRAVDPRGGDFMRLWFSNTFSVPLGGPHRGLARAVARTLSPSTWDSATGPAGGLIDYAEGRLSPGLSVLGDVAANADFLGQRIFNGNFAENIASGLLYLGEQVLPLSIGEGVEARRRGLPFVDGIESALSNFTGASGQELSRFERVETARRGGAMTLLRDATDASLIAAGMVPAQVEAARGVRTLAQLKERIGTTAATRLAEINSPEFSGSYADYSADVLRRAASGDRGAQALAVGITLQRNLAETAKLARLGVAGVTPDKEQYRLARRDVIAVSVGANEQYKDVFDEYRKSTNEIDKLAAKWYDLRDRARRPDGTVDFKLLGDLGDQFYAALPGNLAELVRENVEGPPRGANPLEVELRQVRRNLEDTGFFRMTDEVWTYMRDRDPRAAPFEDRQAYLDATTLDFEARNKERGFPEGVAQAYAKTQAASTSIMERYDTELEKRRLRWVPDHADLADQASAWGYAPDSEAFSKAVRRALDEQIPAPPGSGRGARSVPVPEADPVALWEQGLSYGEVAQRTGSTPGAVEQALRRHYGGSPTVARDALEVKP